MIAPATGEVRFHDSLTIVALCPVQFLICERPGTTFKKLHTSERKWQGMHPSEHGVFEVEVVSGSDDRVHAVFLAHVDPQQRSRGGELERGDLHEQVIAIDLKGQKEFSWGEVGCRLSEAGKKEWLVVAYGKGPPVPRPPEEAIRHLIGQAPVEE
jgi:hypothetical protein